MSLIRTIHRTRWGLRAPVDMHEELRELERRSLRTGHRGRMIVRHETVREWASRTIRELLS